VQPVEESRLLFRRTVIIGAAILANLLVYLVLVEILRARMKPFHGFSQIPLGQVQTLRYLIYGLAVVFIIFIRFLRGSQLRGRPGEEPAKILMRLMRVSVLTYVLAEIPTLLGLILFFVTGLVRDFYILLFVSLILEFMFFPRRAQWEEALSRSGGVS
jgi:hypothetical protein